MSPAEPSTLLLGLLLWMAAAGGVALVLGALLSLWELPSDGEWDGEERRTRERLPQRGLRLVEGGRR